MKLRPAREPNRTQLALDLRGPVDQFDLLHRGPGPYGTVHAGLLSGAARQDNKWIWLRRDDPHAQILNNIIDETDAYLSVNQFRGPRAVSNIVSLRACFVDLDNLHIDFEQLASELKVLGVPSPTFVVWSGRGVHLYWLIDPVPYEALPLWQCVEDELVRKLAPLGSDFKCKDGARILRLVGTANSKANGKRATGYVIHSWRWTLHGLADEVLRTRPAKPAWKQGGSEASIASIEAARAKRGGKPHRAQTGSIYAWWFLVYRDLMTIADHHWFGGVPEAHRDTFLFLMATALSWFTPPAALRDEIAGLWAAFVPTLTKRQVEQYTSTVVCRAEAAARGEKTKYKGQLKDPRYGYGRKKLLELLGDLITDELVPRLRALVPKSVIRARKTERERVRRAQNEPNRTGQGFLQSNAAKRAQALEMAAAGCSDRAIAARVGVARTTVQNWRKQA